MKIPLCIEAVKDDKGLYSLTLPFSTGEIIYTEPMDFDSVLEAISAFGEDVDLSSYQLVVR